MWVNFTNETNKLELFYHKNKLDCNSYDVPRSCLYYLRA